MTRVLSIDVFRGFVMFLMLAEAMQLWTLREAFPGEPFLGMGRVQHHARAVAGVFAPRSDSAGILVPCRSVAPVLHCESPRQGRELSEDAGPRRLAQPDADPARHLPALDESQQTYWTFEDTLTQIGLGYTGLFLIAFAPLRVQVAVFVAILVGFWAAFALYPLPPPASITPASAFPPTGRTSTRVSARTSTRTRISPGHSTCGS